MTGFLKRAGSVILALILALSWIWTDLLRAMGYINDNGRLWILIILSVLLLLQQIYLVIPKPIDRGTVEARRDINQSYLQRFRNKYYQTLRTLNTSDEYPIVRISIMLPTKRARGLFGSYLQVYYYSCPNGVVYSDGELSLKWRKKDGTCGQAWASKQMIIYDSKNPNLNTPGYNLTDEQRIIVNNIKSVLSIPIWHDNQVVGVLNLDSKHNEFETKFCDESIYELAAGCAKIIGAQFDPKGVSA